MQLAEFNAAPVDDAQQCASAWAAVPEWVDAIVSHRSYESVDALAETAWSLSREWGPEALDAALAHHPRIGERAEGEGDEAAASRREQASMDDADADIADQIAAGNAAYEERFGRVFLIRAAGRTPENMLGELRRRLDNDDDTEAREAIEQLRQIALLRLRTTVTEPDTTGPDATGLDTTGPATSEPVASEDEPA